MADEIAGWGWHGERIILKSDGEPNIMVVKKAVGEFREGA